MCVRVSVHENITMPEFARASSDESDTFIEVPIDMVHGLGPMHTNQEITDQFASIVSPEDSACRCGAKMGACRAAWELASAHHFSGKTQVRVWKFLLDLPGSSFSRICVSVA